MKIIIRYFLLTISLLQVLSVFAVYVDSVSISSVSMGNDSSRFKLIAKVHLGSSSCDLQNVNISDLSVDSVSVILCYTGGTNLTVCHRVDTIDLGIRKNGVVNFTVILREATNIQCTNFTFKKDTLYFTLNTSNNNVISFYNGDSFKYSPNPANSYLTITSNFTQPTTLQIFTLEGKSLTALVPLMKQKGAGESKTEIDISFLPQGLYLMVLQSNEQCLVKRVIKQ